MRTTMRTMMMRLKMIYSRWQACKVTNLNHWRRCGYTSGTRSAGEQVTYCCFFFEIWKYDWGENLQIYMLVMFGFCPENPDIPSSPNFFVLNSLLIMNSFLWRIMLFDIYFTWFSMIYLSSQIHWYLISWPLALIWTKIKHSSFLFRFCCLNDW